MDTTTLPKATARDPIAPLQFSLKQRIILAIVPRVVGLLLRLIARTCRITEIGNDIFWQKHRERRLIFGVWHEVLAVGICIYHDHEICTLASWSFDGELAARTCRSLGVDSIRGSSSRGGSEAVQGLVSAIQNAAGVGLTLDGPRGPRRVAKPGVAIISARTGLEIVPVAIGTTRCWRLRSWDRMMVPKPFGHIYAVYGAPIPCPENDEPEAVEQARVAMENALHALHAQLDTLLESSR